VQNNQTKSMKREKAIRLQNRINDLKSGWYMGKTNPEIAQMISWFEGVYWKLPRAARSELDEAWNSYYKLCWNSTEADLMRAMKTALNDKDLVRAKDLQTQARQMLKNGISELPKPKGYDPQIWQNADWAINYNQCKRELTYLEDEEAVSQVTENLW
jgi:hypothetical protein